MFYSSLTGTIAEGEAVIQNEGASTEATGVVISHDTVNKYALLRSTRGSFAIRQAADPSKR